MDTRSFLLGVASADGGGGSSVTVEELNVTSNGTSTAPSGKAYSPVIVNVPNTYTAGDEGKVVSNGALVAQTSDTVTTNDTYDTTLINSLTVNVSGGNIKTGLLTIESNVGSGSAAADAVVIEHNLGSTPKGLMWMVDSATQTPTSLYAAGELITESGYTQANSSALRYDAGNSNYNALLTYTTTTTMKFWRASLPNRYNKNLTAGTVIRWFVW